MPTKALLYGLFVLCFALAARAQNQTPLPQAIIIDNRTAPPDPETRDRMAQDQAKKAAEERQAVLKSDADKLVKLAEDLKLSIEQSNENVLSLDTVKKAGEIEKLAHSLKNKMKGTS